MVATPDPVPIAAGFVPPFPQSPELAPGSLHVWLASTRTGVSNLAQYWSSLAPEEKRLSERYCFQPDKDRCVVAYGSLRSLLSRYLRTAPAALEFGRTSLGKPYLTSPRGSVDLRFNLSHSGDFVAVALTNGAEVGIDIEKGRDLPDCLEVARTVFTPHELRIVEQAAVGDRLKAFFTFWTRKEAYIKARGLGLSLSLDTFDVASGATLQVIQPEADDARKSAWVIQDVEVPDGYFCAVAVSSDARPPTTALTNPQKRA